MLLFDYPNLLLAFGLDSRPLLPAFIITRTVALPVLSGRQAKKRGLGESESDCCTELAILDRR